MTTLISQLRAAAKELQEIDALISSYTHTKSMIRKSADLMEQSAKRIEATERIVELTKKVMAHRIGCTIINYAELDDALADKETT